MIFVNGPRARENERMLPPETLGRFQEMISLAVESIRLFVGDRVRKDCYNTTVIGWLEKSFGAPRYFRVRIAPSGLGALIKVSSLIGFCLLKQIRVYYRISTINLSKR